MALAMTDQRLLVLKISPLIAMGKGGDVKELVSDVLVADVDSIQIKRLLVGKVMTVTSGARPSSWRSAPPGTPRAWPTGSRGPSPQLEELRTGCENLLRLGGCSNHFGRRELSSLPALGARCQAPRPRVAAGNPPDGGRDWSTAS
jgi:hypothetical protein